MSIGENRWSTWYARKRGVSHKCGRAVWCARAHDTNGLLQPPAIHPCGPQLLSAPATTWGAEQSRTSHSDDTYLSGIPDLKTEQPLQAIPTRSGEDGRLEVGTGRMIVIGGSIPRTRTTTSSQQHVGRGDRGDHSKKPTDVGLVRLASCDRPRPPYVREHIPELRR